jgi:hypothetical protein
MGERVLRVFILFDGKRWNGWIMLIHNLLSLNVYALHKNLDSTVRSLPKKNRIITFPRGNNDYYESHLSYFGRSDQQ